MASICPPWRFEVISVVAWLYLFRICFCASIDGFCVRFLVHLGLFLWLIWGLGGDLWEKVRSGRSLKTGYGDEHRVRDCIFDLNLNAPLLSGTQGKYEPHTRDICNTDMCIKMSKYFHFGACTCLDLIYLACFSDWCCAERWSCTVKMVVPHFLWLKL